MDSYLLVVSGVSSCLQRNQIESKKEGGVISVVGRGGALPVQSFHHASQRDCLNLGHPNVF
jgi:hypothetical protein